MSDKQFEILDARVPAERSTWLEYWREWKHPEIFANPTYVELFAEPSDHPICAVFRDSSVRVLLPLIARTIKEIPQLIDLTSPYGYGGAYMLNGPLKLSEAAQFWAKFTEWASSHNVVSEFQRLHLFDQELVAGVAAYTHRSNNVVRDLGPTYDQLWMSFDHKVRKNVKRAQRDGVTVSIHEDAEHHEEFLSLYESTMIRRDAADSYYFSQDFFRRINDELKGHYAYAHAWLDGRVISTELLLISGQRAYSFLGGTDSSAFSSRPNDLLKYEAIVWAKQRGLRSFVLGGGVSPGDGIERYKTAFAPDGILPFNTLERVHSATEYARLTQLRETSLGEKMQSGYFPTYRASADEGSL